MRFGLAVLLLVALTGAAFGSKGDEPHRKRKDAYKDQVEQMEQSWRAAQLTNDVPSMEKLLSDDYVGITMAGQVVTKLQQLDRMRNRQLVLSKIDLDELKVKLIGSTAIVTSLVNVDGTMDGQNMHGMYRYTRVYSRQPTGTWKITNFEATKVNQPGGPRHHQRSDARMEEPAPRPE